VEAGAAKAARTDTINLLDAARALLVSRWSLPAILLVTFAVFIPALNDWFIADDFWWLETSKRVPFGSYFVDAWDFRDKQPVPEFNYYRPLYMVTFRLSYEAFGMHAAGYHALNVALHLAAVALVWFIARRLVSSPALASVMTLIFALHPAYTETVTWISRGNTIMMTVPCLASFLLFMKYVDGGRRAGFYYAGSLLLYVAAFMYHPNALSLVVVLPAYTFLIVRRPSEALRWRSWLPFAPFVLVTIPWAWIQVWVRQEYGLDKAFRPGFHMYSLFGEYLGYSLFPVLPKDWENLHLPSGDTYVTVQLFASLIVLALTLVLLARRRWPFLGVFAVLWFFSSLVFNVTFVLGATPPQLYMPGAGLALFFIVGWIWLGDSVIEFAPKATTAARKVGIPLLLLIVGALISMTLAHEAMAERGGERNQRFVAELRKEVPSVPPGGRLYIISPPYNLVLFSDDALRALVELYYGEVDAVAILAAQRGDIERTLQPNDRIFEYRPGP